MGLDQFAYRNSNETDPEFIWRKHARLQEFMERLFVERTRKDSDALNCGTLELTEDDIATLRDLVEQGRLPDCPGGFFYGHQWQDEAANDYKDQDLKFCSWAKAVLAARDKVIYSCWW